MSYKDTALEVWDMEFTHGQTSAKNAMLAAVESAVATALRAQVVGIRDDLLEKAEYLELNDEAVANPGSLYHDGPAALIWYAILLDETLPPEYRKEEV